MLKVKALKIENVENLFKQFLLTQVWVLRQIDQGLYAGSLVCLNTSLLRKPSQEMDDKI